MSDRSLLDKTDKETFYALGKVNDKAEVFFFKEYGSSSSLKLTQNVDDVYTLGSYERAKSSRNSSERLKELSIIEVTLETRKVYTFKKEIQ
jgi:hypothetical protein